MKKYFTILMAVLCLFAFGTGDANAKKRKRTTNNQQTTKELMLGGYWIIRSVINPDYVLELEGGSLEDYNNIILNKKEGIDVGNQIWYLDYALKKNTYHIRSAEGLDRVITSTNKRNYIYLYELNEKDNSQKWLFEECGNDTFYIRSSKNPSIVMTLGGEAENMTRVIPCSFDGSDSQKWFLEYFDVGEKDIILINEY